ncbi:hypothetical protein PCANC_00379 [Puccinia coronata f. sp. avenae]|uniref:Uncharacterized protein n=1 Tax=Puccinia coronata f. sp. avenae TaxID=200324 RepID=A0A2N5S5P4_9BASI|nr:hypothetical protein PCANC_24534 [Puccinia coronata f. sp. avenae]PLW58868.1 hypothetical protein PCANC_00379 [Puccinia coronata f. sp. avenae]
MPSAHESRSGSRWNGETGQQVLDDQHKSCKHAEAIETCQFNDVIFAWRSTYPRRSAAVGCPTPQAEAPPGPRCWDIGVCRPPTDKILTSLTVSVPDDDQRSICRPLIGTPPDF